MKAIQLDDLLVNTFRLTSGQVSALSKLRIKTVRDALFHFPARYEESGVEVSTGSLTLGETAVVIGTLERLETKKSWKRKVPISEGFIRDSSGRVKAMWFNQPYIAKLYTDGTMVRATGKVSGSVGKLYLANPHLEKVTATEAHLFSKTEYEPVNTQTHEKKLFAVYPESQGITSLWFQHAISKIFASDALQTLEEYIPKDILSRYSLPTVRMALVWIHTPQTLKNAEAARKRFAFEEIFLIQVIFAKERSEQVHDESFIIDQPAEEITDFVQHFPFIMTPAQTKAIHTILEDLKKGTPMSRLLEGDVGSGKTAVAAVAVYATVHTNPLSSRTLGTQKYTRQTYGTLQAAYMAPTEILAKQHFESFLQFFSHRPLPIALITGSGCYKFPSKILKNGKPQSTAISRAQLLKWVENGEISMVVGTHALIQKSVKFKHLALVIIDEQHRFGTNQRRALARKDTQEKISVPHLLSMTATPIPRTLALTLYGNLNLTLLDQMPAGRKKILTEIITNTSREAAYAKIRQELNTGRQAYVICPRIDEPDPEKAFALMAKSVTAEAKRLKKEVFKDFSIEILHSKMTPAQKEKVMKDFSEHKTDILVATSVVEVGVNVPNATLILIEGAERFGLAQLHQLRGRVVRSTHQAYCFLAPQSTGEQSMTRLKALVTAKNGFELAEKDLSQRGPGQLSGAKQWGISDVGMDALKNLKLVEAARSEAQKLIKSDPTLGSHRTLAYHIKAFHTDTHFE